MSILELEDKLKEIVDSQDYENFIYGLLDIYGISRSTITLLKKGSKNLSKNKEEVHLKNKVWYVKASQGMTLERFAEIDNQVKDLAAKPRYTISTDFNVFIAKDNTTLETINVKYKNLSSSFDFFLAWKGIEKVDFENESLLDIRAANKFAKLYDILKKENAEQDLKAINLDQFLMRVLFCLFAEDTGIFKQDIFTNLVNIYSKSDGSDLNILFNELFTVLDEKDRTDTPKYLKDFPYVNGQLFSEPHKDIVFSQKSRDLIIDCGVSLNWKKINPDIFGSMVQAVASDENRSHLGMHYTSVPNILKVINPLFMDGLKNDFMTVINEPKRLEELLHRISKMKFFDPACGPGNFLVITYKEMRRLEIEIIKRLQKLLGNYMYVPSITLSQFYGIEIDEFAHDIAKLSLWIAEHQMNEELKQEILNAVRPTLPLQTAGDIRCANAIRTDWLDVCKANKSEEVFIFGNPPYLGSKKQSKAHKDDMLTLFEDVKNGKQLDYISAWFYLAAKYVSQTHAKVAFVSTNSITQGEQVFTLWNELLSYNIQINFAYKSFKWTNNAKNNAKVIVVIIGFGPINEKEKRYLFENETKKEVHNINPYLVEGENVLVENRTTSIVGLPKLRFGNMPNDGGALLFTVEEYESAIEEYPSLKPYLKRIVGSVEFINDSLRYCLWLDKEQYNQIKDNPLIKDRIEISMQHRKNSKDTGTNKLALTPWKFRDTHQAKKHTIVIPSVSSENRFYIPMGIVDSDVILSNLIYGIYDADVYLLGILMSRMHMTWVKAVAGRLKTDYRYTAGLCYNTFPLPEISARRKNEIQEVTLEILDIREEIGGSLADLYNAEKMPKELKAAHEKLDGIVDRAYKKREFESDEERLSVLLNLYQDLIKGES
ncbi:MULTISPECIES: DNA methyltransferase [Lysinibacillus]|uniref:class I SAM-dependent DNA methyltransferase n=1 Tax=Lysinibacillus TaxID=400634 RepID=UPI00214A9C0F|nr:MULTISPECIES: DNA methyltransferase [Lysinibacillus]UUV23647.1 N-6 DNA methylase [Lysinibacillus sp. FN11]UYB46518.1 N-6 DNA methylase [Lysinibacillus capsici]